jgi:Zn-dependent M28 family amino/carboxypeptidase
MKQEAGQGHEELREALRRDVTVLAGEIGARSAVTEYTNLCRAADFIEQSLAGMGYEVRRQSFLPDHWAMKKRPCWNLEVEIKGTVRPEEIVVIGAHYDTEMSCPGANDNGSGVAALLALARISKGQPCGRTLRFVAFTNEEPPFFWTANMGSLGYASACRERNENIVAMVSLETLGYYTDTPGSQHYPSQMFGWFYPTTGNFISFIGNVRSRSLVGQTLASFRRQVSFPSEGAALPGLISGVGWSDHWSFWQKGYTGVMVTDTAPFRYAHYHTAGDTPEKLDYERFAVVVEGLRGVVRDCVTVE